MIFPIEMLFPRIVCRASRQTMAPANSGAMCSPTALAARLPILYRTGRRNLNHKRALPCDDRHRYAITTECLEHDRHGFEKCWGPMSGGVIGSTHIGCPLRQDDHAHWLYSPPRPS